MDAELVIGPDAQFEIDEAYDWYECRRSGLGERFLSKLNECLQSICHMPTRYGRIQRSYRRAIMKTFPYYVIYEFEADRVSIFSVLHHSRDLSARFDR
jgi:plasmid stabilization system protein ParE